MHTMTVPVTGVEFDDLHIGDDAEVSITKWGVMKFKGDVSVGTGDPYIIVPCECKRCGQSGKAKVVVGEGTPFGVFGGVSVGACPNAECQKHGATMTVPVGSYKRVGDRLIRAED